MNDIKSEIAALHLTNNSDEDASSTSDESSLSFHSVHSVEDFTLKECHNSDKKDRVTHSEDTKLRNCESNTFSRGTDDLVNHGTEDGPIEEYFVDVEHLKDMALTWSDEEKQRYYERSQGLKNTGNENFKEGKYKEAATLYTQGLQICPLENSTDRAVLYANRAAARMNLDDKKGAVKDCDEAITLNESYLKALMRRAKLHEDLSMLDEALSDYKRVLELDPSNSDACLACQFLPQKIEERNEKLKTEMLGKLKDLGNMVLKPFGLSTANFEVTQNSESGGYSINFKQNPGS